MWGMPGPLISKQFGDNLVVNKWELISMDEVEEKEILSP
jgi:hypothetical protein